MTLRTKSHRKPKECTHCGCARKLLVKAVVTLQDRDGAMSYNLKLLCFKCLLAFPKLTQGMGAGSYDLQRVMACVGDDDE